MRTFACIAAGGMILIAIPVSAEVYECDGKWTNKPCQGSITRSLEESGSTVAVDPAVKLVREKTSLLHDVRMKVIGARNDFDLRYDIEPVETFCLKTNSTLEQCREKITKAEEDLERRLANVSAAAAQRRAIELQEEANRIQQERNRIEEKRPTVTIIEEQPLIIVPRRPHDHHTGEAGISVSGTTTSGGVSVEGSITTGETVYDHGNYPVVINPQPRPTRIPKTVTVYDNHGNPQQLDGIKPGPFAPRKNNSSAR